MAKSILSFSTVLGLTAAGLLVACGAATPTKELMDARAAYQQASQGKAAELTPDKLLSAKQALDRAEAAHEDDAGSYQERSLAYVAQRMAELAAAHAGQAEAQRAAQDAERAYVEAQDELRKEAQGGLRDSQERLDKVRRDLKEQEAALAAERAARADAEKKLAALNAKMDQRGMVITLQGAVLFTSGKAVLLPIAQTKLNEVAEVLKQQPDSKRIVIEGHTDSVGSDTTNLNLSQARADAVRVHLISRGVKSDHVTAIGRGESVPIADNKSAEGRANNRRVEIIVN